MAMPWVAAGAYELGRRAITSPMFWNALQLYLYGEQEIEIRQLMRAMEQHQAAQGPREQIPGAPEGCVTPPRVGSGEWYDMLEEVENEIAVNLPPPHRNGCRCNDEEW